MPLSDISDTLNKDNPEIDIMNNKSNGFRRGNLGTIFNSVYQRVNINMFVYFSSVSVNDAINKLSSLDCVKAAPEYIRKVLLNVDFGLEDTL